MRVIASVLLLVGVVVGVSACEPPQTADLVLTNGYFHTLETEMPTAESVAVKDGRIIELGDATETLAHVGEGTRVIDLAGAHAYPGFTDSHAHLLGIGEREMTFNLDDVGSVAELQQRVAERASEIEAGEWIIGRGWIETHWPNKAFPTRSDLDKVAPENPVALMRADGHALVANSRALELAGIDAATEAPFGGEILRDSNSQPTGMLVDNAMALLDPVMPEGDVAAEDAYIVGAQRSARLGWTQLQDAGATLEKSRLLRRLAEEGRLAVRVYSAIEGPSESTREFLKEGPVDAAAEDMFSRRTIKVSVDGALGSRGAALLEPYSDADTTGLITWKEADLLPLYRKALRTGVQIETHAIGDRANRFVLDLYERVFNEIPPEERAVAEPRWRIEHAQVLHEDDIPRFAELGVIPSMQASHAIGDLYFAPDRLGEERLAGAYAWRKLLDSGVIIPGGSDAPVEVGDPRIEFYAAVARAGLEDGFQGEGWHPEQAMTRQEALKSLTLWPAFAAFEEDVRGTLKVGKYADFTVFGGDLLSLPLEEIPATPIVMTVVNGRIVHDARDLP